MVRTVVLVGPRTAVAEKLFLTREVEVRLCTVSTKVIIVATVIEVVVVVVIGIGDQLSKVASGTLMSHETGQLINVATHDALPVVLEDKLLEDELLEDELLENELLEDELLEDELLEDELLEDKLLEDELLGVMLDEDDEDEDEPLLVVLVVVVVLEYDGADYRRC